MNREKFLSCYDIFIDNDKFKYNTITKAFDLNNHYQKYSFSNSEKKGIHTLITKKFYLK